MSEFSEYVTKAARAAGYDIDSLRGGGKKALAEKAGMSHASVGRVLSGKTGISPAAIPGLAAALDVPVSSLLVASGLVPGVGELAGAAEPPVDASTSARFAAWLREARVTAGLSQRELAEAVAPQGFHWIQSKIAKIEGGDLIPRLDEAVALTTALDATLDAALGLKPDGAQSLASRDLARRTSLLQQISSLVEAELGGGS